RHSLLVGTGLGVAAGAAFFGGLLGTYLTERQRVLVALQQADKPARFLPRGVVMPEIPSNMMLIVLIFATVMAQWAVYAMRRGERRHTAMAITLTALFGLAALNLQIAVYRALAIGL